MLKKMVFVAAVLLVAGAVYAAQPTNYIDTAKMSWETWDDHANLKSEVWKWPAEYTFQAVCAIPVKMDVGFWIRVEKCQKLELKLHQVDIRHYAGEITGIQIRTNVNIDLDTKFDLKAGFPGASDGSYISPTYLDAGGPWSVTVGAKIKDVNLEKLTPTSDCIDVGTVYIRVRPAVAPDLGGGCS